MTSFQMLPPLMLISDAQRVGQDRFLATLDEAWAAGLPMLQIREPHAPREVLHSLVAAIKSSAPPERLIVINRQPQMAVEWHLDGVHVGGGKTTDVRDARSVVGIERLVGYSAHEEDEIASVIEAGADYVTYSPILGALSKDHPLPAVGVDQLGAVCSRFSIPVYALGGMTPKQAVFAKRAGAVGVATIGAILDSPEPGRVVKEFLSVWNEG